MLTKVDELESEKTVFASMLPPLWLQIYNPIIVQVLPAGAANTVVNEVPILDPVAVLNADAIFLS
jgi:hypothetical protein